VSNHFSLTTDWEIGSRDLEGFARAQGWWTSGGRVDVAAAYRNPGIPGRISEGRLRRSRALLDAAHGRIDVAVLQSILRDHLDGGPVRATGTTPEDEAFYTLCMHSEPIGTTTASLVAPLPRERRMPWPVWISFATPCTGVFLPVYLDGLIPAELARGGADPAAGSAWWAFKMLQDAASDDFPRHTPWLREMWKAFESRIETERIAVEQEAGRARTTGSHAVVTKLLTDFMTRIWRDAIAQARELASQIS
jgi:secernin